MARPRVNAHALAAAVADVAAGFSQPEAASRNGISARTLWTALQADKTKPARAKGSTARPTRSRPGKAPPRASVGAPDDQTVIHVGGGAVSTLDGAPVGRVEPIPEMSPSESLLDTLTAELRHARKQRAEADTDAARRAWSKIVRELVGAIRAIAPPPPPPPDLLLAELRRLDGEAIALIEQHLPDRIDPDEIVAALSAGRSPMLAFGKVLAVEDDRVQWQKTAQPYGSIYRAESWLHFPERVLVL
jgi:helix-turn-helix, Psq domain